MTNKNMFKATEMAWFKELLNSNYSIAKEYARFLDMNIKMSIEDTITNLKETFNEEMIDRILTNVRFG